MAINKSFVIKNGVQVSTDLIIGDADNNKVGIGTTIPFYNLHVGRGRGSRGGIGVTDAVVSGVATINQLSVTGISTFAGALDVNSTVDFAGDVVFNGTNDITYDQSESALVFNDNAAIRVGTGSDFSIMHDGSNTILRERGTGGLKILGSQIELLGSTAGETLAKFTEDGGIELYDDNTKKLEITGLGATVFGDLTVSGVTTSARLLVTGISTFTGLVDANGGAHIDNLRLGIDADNDITTSSGNLTLDSTGGTVEVNDNLQVDGQTDLNGDINLGNATSDTITATGRFDSDIVPSTDGARDLGSGSLEWRDLYVDGIGYIDSIESDGGSFGNIQVGETGDNEIDTASLNLILDSAGGTINIDDNLTVAGVSTFSGIGSFGTDMNVGITTFFVDKSTGRVGVGTNVPTATLEIGKTAGTGIGVSIFENGNACFSGIVTVGGNLIVGGTINLGDANTDNVVFGADVDSNIIPDDDNTYDLGSSGQQWKDIYIHGVGYIDSISADTAAISDLTDNRVVIAGSGGELEDSGNLTFDGSTLAVTGDETVSGKITVSTGSTLQANGAAAFAGIVTANGGLLVGANGTLGSTAIGATISTNGNAGFVGIVTAASFNGNLNATQLSSGTVPIARLGDSGTKSGSTFLAGDNTFKAVTSTTINNNADNRVITGSGSADTLEAESSLTFDGSKLNVGSGVATVMTDGNAAFAGIVTAGRGFNIGIVSAGFTVARNVGISSLNFIGAGNTFLYNSTTRQLDISISGSGGGGGVSETSTSVSSTSATACGSFDKTEKRSAAVLAQITQGSAYQIGRYLLIHDGTTVTTIEESAIATGSMLGTFEGVINGDDVEFRVTMSSSSNATVITKIDSISI